MFCLGGAWAYALSLIAFPLIAFLVFREPKSRGESASGIDEYATLP
jgi:hypothetical protein